MFEAEQRQYAELGGDYFWLAGKRGLAWSVFRQINPDAAANGKVLDIGCGPGYAFAEAAGWGELYGLDPSREALLLCRQNSRQGARLVNGSAERLPYKDGSFSVVIAFEIFEHLENDAAAIGECFRILQPGGWLIFTVPAFQWLWGDHDDLYFHKRRYTTGQMRRRLREAGFRVKRLTYCHALFTLPLWLTRRVKRWTANGTKRDDFVRLSPRMNRFLTGVVLSESILLKQWDMPCGTSIIGIACKS
ncbi:MAG: class I SAM-dependent methyltransferase [Candidatus Omnitrophica bacterium]|nr:class I SAM-dependent methyltransferase [Candidatus Omnitrophota bacterium]